MYVAKAGRIRQTGGRIAAGRQRRMKTDDNKMLLLSSVCLPSICALRKTSALFVEEHFTPGNKINAVASPFSPHRFGEERAKGETGGGRRKRGKCLSDLCGPRCQGEPVDAAAWMMMLMMLMLGEALR